MTDISHLVIYEDNHLIAINKTCGQIVQGDKTGDVPLLDLVKNYIKHKYNKPGDVFLGLIHRLDRPVSGVIVFAKTSKALTRMNNLFRENKINKKYWAIVGNIPDVHQAKLRNYLRKNEKQNKSYVCQKNTKGAKEAILDYKLISSINNYHLLEVMLHTGRHHQIRCQLANINSPIKGDLKYSYPRSNPDGGIDLHARELEFTHPVTKINIKIIAPLPKTGIWEHFDV